MSDAFAQFEKRLDSLERKHRKLANGYVAKINPDGLITVVPKEKRTAMGLRLLGAVIVAFVLFKSAVLTIVGPLTYIERIDVLAAGNGFEKLCAWIMQADRVSLAVSELLLRTFG